MRIVVNGEDYTLGEGATVAELIDTMGLKVRRFAVEVNREIVPRDRHADHVLRDGDHVEVIQFVGGG